jgi:succinate-semialdehyde dehydrogenase/glutarate-semialdehyde dehydrogenase
MAGKQATAKQHNARDMMSPDPQFVKSNALIGGQWVAARSGKSFAVQNPADLSEITHVPDMAVEDVQHAIGAAQRAFEDWRTRLPLERGKILSRWASLIEENADDLALLMTCEQGKPFKEARGEVVGAAATIQWCSEEGRRVYGEFLEGPKPGSKIIVSRHPVGVVGAITPWNFPASMITRKVGPALAAGCTVVLKPAESTPLTALALGALALEAGLPDGVFNVITSQNASEIGKVLTSDARVRKISFTGSTEVGRKLMAQAAEHIQKVSLELGGNAPFIVFESADIEKAAEGAIASKFRNAGQTCICANRIYVHNKIFDEFLAVFHRKIDALRVGPGWQDGVTIGPLINLQAIEKIEKMIAQAQEGGATVLTGGKRHALGSTFFEPTLMTGVQEDADLATGEIFGPVAAVYGFDSDDDIVARANDTPFGLAAYIYSDDLKQVWRITDALQYGMVGINEPLLATDLAPFGGVKESGTGREGGKYGLLEYVDIKYRLFS